MFFGVVIANDASEIDTFLTVYNIVQHDNDSTNDKLNPFTATSRDRATMLNSHRDSHERGEAQLQESERISPKFQLEPEI